jgi:hypothetical protein
MLESNKLDRRMTLVTNRLEKLNRIAAEEMAALETVELRA